jgi:hypothetical protein
LISSITFEKKTISDTLLSFYLIHWIIFERFAYTFFSTVVRKR